MDERPEIVVPQEAADRGHLLRGELRSEEVRIAGILAQFSGLSPHTRDAQIFFYPTLDQAKILLEARSPLSFEGQLALDSQSVSKYRSSEIWLNYGSKITFFEMCCYTGCSGRLVDLEIGNEPPILLPDLEKVQRGSLQMDAIYYVSWPLRARKS